MFFNVVSAQQITTVYPLNNFSFNNKNNIFFLWNKSFVANIKYQFQLSTDIAFSSLLVNTELLSNTYLPNSSIFNPNVTYYWRVRPKNTPEWSTTASFILSYPTMFTSLNTWFRSDTNFHLTSGKVDTWNDLSSSNLIGTQSNASRMPTYISNVSAINNYPAIGFTASAINYLLLDKSTTNTNFTILILRNFIANGGDAQFVLGGNGNSGVLADASVISYGFGLINGSQFLGARVTDQVSQYSIYSHKNSSIRRNKISPTLAQNTPLLGINYNAIGSRPDNFSYMLNANIAEIIGYSDTLNSADLEKMEDYYRYKYAPPVYLGLDTVFGNSFCDTFRIKAGNIYTSYLWSTGETTSSIKATANGIYSVKVKDIFGFESTDDIQVLPYRRLGNKTVYFCIGDTFKLDLKTPAGFTVLWNTGSTSTKIDITQNGIYTVKITDSRGCFVFDTLNVFIENPQLLPIPDINDSIRVCLNEKLFLNTATSFDSIRWSTGSTNTFIPVSAPGTYNVYGRTTTGCVISKTFKVKVNGEAPVAKFGYSNVCQNATTFFTDSSTHSAASTITNWKWTFGDGNSSVSQNASNTYSGLGTYTVGFKITTNQNCFDSISKTIIVNKRPEPSFYNLLSCAGIPTTFVDQSVANSASITDWNWNFGGLGSIAGINNPSFKFPSAGDYNVQLTVTNSNGCREDTTILTTVEVAPIADFSYDSVCGKTPVTFKFLGTVAPPNTIPNLSWGKWDFGDNQIETAIKSPQHVYNAPGTYEVKLIVNSSNQCVDTVVKQVKVFDFPVVDFNVSQTQCVGKEIQFTDISATPDGTPINTWNWFFSGQSTSDEQNPRYTFNEEGNYIIQLTAKNSVGCTGTKLRSIAVSSLPTPKFTFSPQNGLPPLCVTYTNQSPVSGNYLWSYGDGGSLIEGYNPPQHCYNTIGTYPIKLIATDFRGCTDTLTKFILVDKAYLDGVMTSITIIPTSGDFYKIQVSIKNNSNIQITDLGLSLQLGGGSVIRENWTGSLLPGQTTVYLFTGEIKLSENNQIPIVCASIDNVNNNAFEDRTDNNTTCKEVKVGNFDVFNIYPNPAFENINFGVMLPKDGRVNIRFIDILGQLMYNKDFDGLKGYNNFQMSTMPLNAAVYVAEIYYDGQIIRKKFMRKDRK